MSDVGYLSYQHEQAAGLAARLDKALAEANERKLTLQTRQQLARELVGLIALLEPLDGDTPYAKEMLGTPPELLELLRERSFHGQTFAEALAQLERRLLNRDEELRQVDLELLKALILASETTALSTYRRMIRG